MSKQKSPPKHLEPHSYVGPELRCEGCGQTLDEIITQANAFREESLTCPGIRTKIP
jgi:hypothetical protein